MERALSPEEKIRRAEEIYYRRKMQEENRNYARVSVTKRKKNLKMLKKITFQIIVCVIIYTVFYEIKNKVYIFSKNIINKTKEILSYDINLLNMYEKAKEYMNSFNLNSEQIQENKVEDEQIEIKNNEEQSVETEEIKKVQEIEHQETQLEETQPTKTEIVEGIGGENVEELQIENIALSQMEQDAKDIKEAKSIILPLKGTITSRFGIRESNNPIVSKNHTGIDIAVNEGTIFNAAMEGIVEEVSSIRSIRQSHKNNKW